MQAKRAAPEKGKGGKATLLCQPANHLESLLKSAYPNIAFCRVQSEAVEEAVRTEARVLQERGGAAGPAPRTVVVETPGGGRTTEIVEVAASLPLSGAPVSTTTVPAAEVLICSSLQAPADRSSAIRD